MNYEDCKLTKEILYTVYTHTDCMDVWPVFFGQTEKHVCRSIDKAIFVDKLDEDIKKMIPEEYEVYVYDDSLPYASRVLSCIEQISHEYILFHHEDMPLYDNPNWDKIESYVTFMEENDYDSIRLIKSGEMGGNRVTDDLVSVPKNSEYNFVVQPTVIKTKRMIEMFTLGKNLGLRSFEPNVPFICQKINLKSYYADTTDIRRGGHYDSSVYPYIATAVVRGKWNTNEYKKELDKMFSEYKIDPSIRGEIN